LQFKPDWTGCDEFLSNAIKAVMESGRKGKLQS